MGKATILPSGQGIELASGGHTPLARGQYKIRVEKDNARAEAESKRIEGEIDSLESAIPERYSEYEDARKVYGNRKEDLNVVILQSKEAPEEDYTEKIKSASAAERSASNDLIVSKSRYQAVRLQQRALQGKRIYLDGKITEDIRYVWCADCQRNLTGEVATIEIPNTDQKILIRPGGADPGNGYEYNAARDGQLKSVASMSAAEAAWNYTMLPAWQKFKPLYRLGKITESFLNSSKCSVLLDAYSTAQGLATDIERKLVNVPMFYKGRDDGGPYQMGDRVVVEFYNQNWEAPRVVGFEDYPCTTSSTTTTTTILPERTFYIRFNLNSCTPTYGGYEIKLDLGEDEYLYGYSHDSDKELVGPFTTTGYVSPYASLRDQWHNIWPWEPNTYYDTVGTDAYIRTKTAYSTRGVRMLCTQAGTTGDTEPDWNTESGLINDGTVIWQRITPHEGGSYFFGHWVVTDEFDGDPETIRREVGIFYQTYVDLNNNLLHTPATGDFYIKPAHYKKHLVPVFDCSMAMEEIDGGEYEVYTIDFTSLKRMKSTVSGQRFEKCLLGQGELTSDGVSLNYVSKGITLRWQEEARELPRASDSYPYWIPRAHDTTWGPEMICALHPECGAGWDYADRAYPGVDALGIDELELVDASTDLNYSYCIISDEDGNNPNYPGLNVHFEVGRGPNEHGTPWRKEYLE